eukprot:12905493-Prorocentrum_lima.AAC.1
MEALPLQRAQVAETGVGGSTPSCFERTVAADRYIPAVAAVEVSYPDNMIIAKKVFFHASEDLKAKESHEKQRQTSA